MFFLLFIHLTKFPIFTCSLGQKKRTGTNVSQNLIFYLVGQYLHVTRILLQTCCRVTSNRMVTAGCNTVTIDGCSLACCGYVLVLLCSVTCNTSKIGVCFVPNYLALFAMLISYHQSAICVEPKINKIKFTASCALSCIYQEV